MSVIVPIMTVVIKAGGNYGGNGTNYGGVPEEGVGRMKIYVAQSEMHIYWIIGIIIPVLKYTSISFSV